MVIRMWKVIVRKYFIKKSDSSILIRLMLLIMMEGKDRDERGDVYIIFETSGTPLEYVHLGPCNQVCRHCSVLFWYELRLTAYCRDTWMRHNFTAYSFEITFSSTPRLISPSYASSPLTKQGATNLSLTSSISRSFNLVTRDFNNVFS
uniref:Uncharacterized protein n=1 Tax=Tanacetum cinerariifolium TaxID=118510 RepID=A0A699JBP2_TANCI|nr:hypothetical protein [Tanacetum cinerariifolium]